MIAVYLAKN